MAHPCLPLNYVQKPPRPRDALPQLRLPPTAKERYWFIRAFKARYAFDQVRVDKHGIVQGRHKHETGLRDWWWCDLARLDDLRIVHKDNPKLGFHVVHREDSVVHTFGSPFGG